MDASERLRGTFLRCCVWLLDVLCGPYRSVPSGSDEDLTW